VFLELIESFVVELLFIPVVLGEELVSARSLLAGRTSREIPVTVLLLAATRPVM
jgi:hypothetical protein